MLKLSQFLTLAILILIAQKTFFVANTPTIEPTKKEIITPIVEQKTETITALKSPSFEKPTVSQKKVAQKAVQPEPIELEKIQAVKEDPSLRRGWIKYPCVGYRDSKYDTIPYAVRKEYPEEKIAVMQRECIMENPIIVERVVKEGIMREPIIVEEVLSSEEIFNTPKNIECRVFPNPATEYITVELSDVAEATMTLMSSNGQLVWTSLTQDQTTVLNLQDYPAGVYFLQVVAGAQNMVKSVVIQ